MNSAFEGIIEKGMQMYGNKKWILEKPLKKLFRVTGLPEEAMWVSPEIHC